MNSKINNYLAYFFICVGICLATFQFAYNRILWLDEAMLSLNIINKGFFDLLKPLDYHQVSPIGFLFAEKIFVLLLGNSEYGLRAFPFICYLAAIPLVYFFSHVLSRDKAASLLSVSMFSVSLSLISYASEVKQYMVDVLFALAIPTAALSLDFKTARSLVMMVFIGSMGIFMSNISVVSLFVTATYLVFSEIQQKKNFKILIVLLC